MARKHLELIPREIDGDSRIRVYPNPRIPGKLNIEIVVGEYGLGLWIDSVKAREIGEAMIRWAETGRMEV